MCKSLILPVTPHCVQSHKLTTFVVLVSVFQRHRSVFRFCYVCHQKQTSVQITWGYLRHKLCSINSGHHFICSYKSPFTSSLGLQRHTLSVHSLWSFFVAFCSCLLCLREEKKCSDDWAHVILNVRLSVCLCLGKSSATKDVAFNKRTWCHRSPHLTVLAYKPTGKHFQ